MVTLILKELFSIQKVFGVLKLMCCVARNYFYRKHCMGINKIHSKTWNKKISYNLRWNMILIQLVVCFPSPRQGSGIENTTR